MADKKFVLIVDKNTNALSPINENAQLVNGKKQYRLSGIFTEFDVLNRNERVYTPDKFLPHLDEMNHRMSTLGVVFGELDHPQNFDMSLSKVSHKIEKAFYNKEKNRVDGQIKLLSTFWGKEAREIVDGGDPLFVSSRAAGITESNGIVSVKKLFTYDLVADPGFASAVVSLNESCGYPASPASNFRIFEITDESKINELFNMNNDDFVTKRQMTEYSAYLTGEIAKVKSNINESMKSGEVAPEKIVEMSDMYETMRMTQDKILTYLDYLADTVHSYTTQLESKIEKTTEYTKYVAEVLDKNIEFTEYVAENVNNGIKRSDLLESRIEKTIAYTEYIAENVDKNISYAQYIAETLGKNIEYSEYIAESLDKNIAYSEYLAENLDQNITYSEYLAEHLDNNIAYSQYIAEHVDNNIAYSEYVAENVSDTQAYIKYIAEGLDNTMESIKNGKLNENNGQVQLPDMKNIGSVSKYYDEFDNDGDDDDDDITGTVNIQGEVVVQPVKPNVEEQPTQLEPVAPVVAEVEPAVAQVEPIEGTPIEGTEPQGQETVNIDEPVGSVEGQPISTITTGSVVSVGDKTGEVIATDATSGIVTIKLDETGDTVNVQESAVSILVGQVTENKDLKNYIGNLITETKKRKASDEKDPHFLQFLTEKNKQFWHGLSADDKDAVKFAINEGANTIYTEAQVMSTIAKTLTKEKSHNEILLENMPASLKPIWESVAQEFKISILNTSAMYPNLNTAAKIESFWESRKLENYLSVNESKKVVNENVYDNNSLSDEYINSFIARLKNIG